jgi:hypothetical protein
VSGFLPELYERLDHGGVLGQVFEVLHFPESERCTGPFRGYVAYNYRDNMEASGWASMTEKVVATLTEEEKAEICDRVQEENRGLCRPRPDHVEDNASTAYTADNPLAQQQLYRRSDVRDYLMGVPMDE